MGGPGIRRHTPRAKARIFARAMRPEPEGSGYLEGKKYLEARSAWKKKVGLV
jgi:hypothetical protein